MGASTFEVVKNRAVNRKARRNPRRFAHISQPVSDTAACQAPAANLPSGEATIQLDTNRRASYDVRHG